MPLIFPLRQTSIFEPPSTLETILSSPLKIIVRILHAFLLHLRGPAYTPPPGEDAISVVCISDTHTNTPAVPSGDVLIHAGDLTNAGTVAEIQAQIDWLASLPHPHKIAIAGNHDSYLDPRSRRDEDIDRKLDWKGIHYLQHSEVKVIFDETHTQRALRIYGAPQIPQCGGSDFAFQYLRDEDAWSGTIPEGIDILVTHTPPKYHLDLPRALGCRFLLEELWKTRPILHVFGHIHAGRGRQEVWWDGGERAFERVSARKDRGVLRDIFAVWAWLDVLRMLYYGIIGILWTRVWGGEAQGTTMVNAAMVYNNTGKLGPKAQVVYI